MQFVMVCREHAGISRPGQPPAPVGQYLKSYDPEFHDGEGYAEWTADIDEAMTFASQVDGVRLWRTVPRARPVRGYDGRPNRPLTAFTVDLVNKAVMPGGAFARGRAHPERN